MTVAVPRWEHFDHQADIGVRGSGSTLAEAFEQGALALSAVVTPLDHIAARTSVPIACTNNDTELLFVDWLNAIVYEMATRKMLFGRYAVRIEDHELTARAWGERVDLKRHQPAVEIKGATYTALHVGRRNDDGWIAETVIDV